MANKTLCEYYLYRVIILIRCRYYAYYLAKDCWWRIYIIYMYPPVRVIDLLHIVEERWATGSATCEQGEQLSVVQVVLSNISEWKQFPSPFLYLHNRSYITYVYYIYYMYIYALYTQVYIYIDLCKAD